MALITLKENDQIMMSLVHYFVTKENYTPINVQGVKDEIWLENLDGPYRVIRITCNSIINEEQFKFDIFKMRHIIKQIKKKTLSFKVSALNICLDISDKLNLDSEFGIDSIKVASIDDVKSNNDLNKIFPGIQNELFEAKDSLDLIVNVTNDINSKTEKENKKFAQIFSPKKIIVTYILIIACIIMFALMYIWGGGSRNQATLIFYGANYYPYFTEIGLTEAWRLIASAFLHIGIIHLLTNMYTLFVIGTQAETFLGKTRFIFIYLISALTGSLLSMATGTVLSAGASGAIFGLMGALLYFGYHYRLYLNDVLRRQIIPLIILNLLLGFFTNATGGFFGGYIDNFAHIGGLIGGYLATMAVGVPGKANLKEKINGWIVLILYIGFLSYILFWVR